MSASSSSRPFLSTFHPSNATELPLLAPYHDSTRPVQSQPGMGPLRTVYHVTSNIRADNHPDQDPRHSQDESSEYDPLVDSSIGEGIQAKEPWSSPVWRYIPEPLGTSLRAVITWAKGPIPPRPWSITPFFPKLQTAPIRLLDQYAPTWKQRFGLLILFYLCWLVCFVSLVGVSASSGEIPGYGTPTTLSCTATFWSPKNGCGVNGSNCRPFNGTSLAFRCPASCIKTHVLNPHAVGAGSVNYQPLVIGGPSDPSRSVETALYRGDSFICGAAIHAGFIADETGGCGVVAVAGEGVDYPASDQHSIPSVGFDSNFPLSFRFVPGSTADCRDLRWPLLAVDVIFCTVLSLFTTSPAVFFGTIFTALFFHTGLVSDPPYGHNFRSLVSTLLGRFLPAAFVAFVMYKYVVRKSLTGLNAQIEKTILWLGPCFVGILNNYTFDRIPIQRLTPHDIQAQAGAVGALVTIVLVIFFIALGQAWAIRIAGLMPRYLALYAAFVAVILVFIAVPRMDLRIHHYILALVLLPGTALQTRPSLLFQGLLVGLFINGVARWGFDSILQTPGELRGDGQIGSLLPDIGTPAVGANSITFDWGVVPYPFTAISVLVNDVERFRAYDNDTDTYTWTRRVVGHPEYFRFGYIYDGVSQDYTKAGTLNADGTWTPAQRGPSRM